MPQALIPGAAVPANALRVGFEHGCYTATATTLTSNTSGACTPSGRPALDGNGFYWLNYSATGAAAARAYTVAGDSLTITLSPTVNLVLTRVLAN